MPDDASPPPAVEADAERRYRAPALEKGLDILELLASNGRAMTASQISAALDRSMSELFRMIQVLEYKGYISTAESGDGYELSNKLFTLAMARAPVRTLLEAAMPVMRELSAGIGQSCHLAVASDDQMVVVARVESPGYLGFSVRPGYRRNVVDATSGVVLFAFQSVALRAAWTFRLERIFGPAVVRAFIARSDEVRERGFEQADSDFVKGVTDLSTPVMVGDSVAAALTVPLIRSTATPEDATVIRRLQEAGRLIEAELGAPT